MPCLSRYAEAWEYATFWCIGSLLKGVDNSGGGPNAALVDSAATFRASGVKAGIGQVLYNLTTGLSGVVTAVTDTTITATGVTWTDGDVYRIVTLSGSQIASIENILDMVTSDITVALQSVGACDCTLSAAGTNLVRKLSVIEAGIFYNCPCGDTNLSDDQRAVLLEWMTTQLTNILNGTLELCTGATGANFPAIGWAEMAYTEFNANQIIINRMLRDGEL